MGKLAFSYPSIAYSLRTLTLKDLLAEGQKSVIQSSHYSEASEDVLRPWSVGLVPLELATASPGLLCLSQTTHSPVTPDGSCIPAGPYKAWDGLWLSSGGILAPDG